MVSVKPCVTSEGTTMFPGGSQRDPSSEPAWARGGSIDQKGVARRLGLSPGGEAPAPAHTSKHLGQTDRYLLRPLRRHVDEVVGSCVTSGASTSTRASCSSCASGSVRRSARPSRRRRSIRTTSEGFEGPGGSGARHAAGSGAPSRGHAPFTVRRRRRLRRHDMPRRSGTRRSSSGRSRRHRTRAERRNSPRHHRGGRTRSARTFHRTRAPSRCRRADSRPRTCSRHRRRTRHRPRTPPNMESPAIRTRTSDRSRNSVHPRRIRRRWGTCRRTAGSSHRHTAAPSTSSSWC